jgi:hypothetical protein
MLTELDKDIRYDDLDGSCDSCCQTYTLLSERTIEIVRIEVEGYGGWNGRWKSG